MLSVTMSLAIRENTNQNHSEIPFHMAHPLGCLYQTKKKKERKKRTSCEKDVEKLEPGVLLVGMKNSLAFETCDPAIPLLVIYTK